MKKVYKDSVVVHRKDLEFIAHNFIIEKPFAIYELWVDYNDDVCIVEHYNRITRFILSAFVYIPNIIIGGIKEATDELTKMWRDGEHFTHKIWSDERICAPLIEVYKSKKKRNQ